jgi:hypothetical protein
MGSIPNQIGQTIGNLPYSQQQNFGSMIGEVQSHNPNCDSAMVGQFLNNAARKFYDRRLWYGLMVKGQLVSPPVTTGGSVQLTVGSQTVTGTGTNFSSSLVGQSLRVGYNNPPYNVTAVASPTSLTIELPWGGTTYSSVGYFIAQLYYSIPNIKYIYAAINMQLQMRMWTNLTQQSLDNLDPSRQQVMYPWCIAGMPPDALGNYQCELYPASFIQQAFPYIAYVQPPNLINDGDSLPPFIRCDIIKAHAISDALRYRTKDNPYYSEAVCLQIAKEKMSEFEGETLRMEQSDENQYRQDIQMSWEMYPFYQPGGSFWNATHPIMADGAGGWGEGNI